MWPILLIVAAVLVVIIWVMINLPQWGKIPNGEFRNKVIQSKQFNGKQFQNISETPNFAEGYSMSKVMKDFMFKKVHHKSPVHTIHVLISRLNSRHETPYITWFGHSSYLLQVSKLNILVDPVFSKHASPLPFGARAFKHSYEYTVEDMPIIDALVITHDHYDHLDYKTVKRLIPKIRTIITSVGVKSHLVKWGFDPQRIQELDWWEESNHLPVKFTATPSRHFSGRGLKRNMSLWSSFVLEAGIYKIYIGGDSGYDSHFKEIGKKFGPFDLAILENGQYNEAWHYIHMLPNETVKAAQDLGAKILMPVHWGKFALAMHPWNESIRYVLKVAEKESMDVLSPQIGQTIDALQPYVNLWWKDVH